MVNVFTRENSISFVNKPTKADLKHLKKTKSFIKHSNTKRYIFKILKIINSIKNILIKILIKIQNTYEDTDLFWNGD